MLCQGKALCYLCRGEWNVQGGVAYKSFSNQYSVRLEKSTFLLMHKLPMNTFQKPTLNLSNEHFKK